MNTLRTASRRYRTKISTMKDLLVDLKEKQLISENAADIINASLPSGSEKAGALMRRFLKGQKNQSYTPELRAFALTLNFDLGKAYNYVREVFNNTLPHPRTLGKWYQSVDGSPGFTLESLTALKIKTQAAALKGHKIFYNLVMDEMSIRKQIEWTGKKFTGYVDFGSRIDSDELQEAREALVFMLVALNDFFKIPVAYFLVNALQPDEKANIVLKVLEFIHDTGVRVTSFTFDGAATNISMAKSLQANFDDSDNLKTYFLHPISKENIYIFFDPCHMLKLWRNCLASQKELLDGENKSIKWNFFEKLVNLQNIEGLHLGTKIRNRHLMWAREKMKVNGAAQTFSNSVADAMLYLQKDLKHPDFQGAEATADFTKIINNIFDIFNVRNRLSNRPFRKPLSSGTVEKYFNYLDNCSNYIKGIKLNEISILKSRRKTGFLGFLIDIQSLKEMYKNYCQGDQPALKYLLTYKISQDHLEIFSSAIRSKGGSNNNPSARAFEAIYKRLLVRSEIKGSDMRNSIALDNMPILHRSSKIVHSTALELLDSDEVLRTFPEIQVHDYIVSDLWHLTTYIDDVLSHMSGFVLKTLRKTLNCTECLKLCNSDNPEDVSKLQLRKTFGNLDCASEFLKELCKSAEKSFRFFKATHSIFKKQFKIDTLINYAFQNLPYQLYDYFGKEHLFDYSFMDCHCNQLLKIVLKIFFKIGLHYETKKINDENVRIRSIFTKTVLFKN